MASQFPGQIQYPTTGWSFTINGLPITLPCNPPGFFSTFSLFRAVNYNHLKTVNPNPVPTFYCQAFNATLTPTCAKYINYDVLIPPPFYSQTALSAFIAPNLKSTTALPSACKSYAEELICTSAFQPCSQTPMTLPSPPSPAAAPSTIYLLASTCVTTLALLTCTYT